MHHLPTLYCRWYDSKFCTGESVKSSSRWLEGVTRSGKTTQLIAAFQQWVKLPLPQSAASVPLQSKLIVLAANEHNRRELADKLSLSVQGRYPISCKTPLGFITDEVLLFFPLLFEQLQLPAQWPLRLRPETEQELATQLWRKDWAKGDPLINPQSEYRFVRQTLDLLQLAGASCLPPEDISILLAQGLGDRADPESDLDSFSVQPDPILAQQRGEFLLAWREWCLARGFLTYGIIYELYWRYLLPDPQYQRYLFQRFQGVLADNVDDYPAIAKDLFSLFLDQDCPCLLTYNLDGQIRLGINADPQALRTLRDRCQIETLGDRQGVARDVLPTVLELTQDSPYLTNLPDCLRSIQTTTRAQLLRKTAEFIIESVNQGAIHPQEIAIIAPGLDEIARYSLIEILSKAGIPVVPLNEQRPLIGSALIRSLLTLLALVYPGLGQWISRDEVAEMLVVLSLGGTDPQEPPAIDPVRAGLLADHCFFVSRDHPKLLPYDTFERWDRLSYRSTQAYDRLRQWIEDHQTQIAQSSALFPIHILDRAIKEFVLSYAGLNADQLSALRELMETAQHFWEVDQRLRQKEPSPRPTIDTLAQFLQLLRRGTITANPKPLSSLEAPPPAITLATIYQYRSLRSHHRWQFWLDVSSPLWQQGGASNLFAAPLFLRDWSGQPLTPEDDWQRDRDRLELVLKDLLGRADEQVIFCHSDLSIKGTEQTGSLLVLVQSSQEVQVGEIHDSKSAIQN